jgi:GTP-binding protein Era
MSFRFGYVAILGRPNAGKSTLVNALVGQKVAIVSPRPQTTRNRIQGIVNRPGAQIVLVDTPGIHRPESALGRQMMEEVSQALDGVDALALIVDAAENRKPKNEKRKTDSLPLRHSATLPPSVGPGDRYAIEMARRFRGPVFLLLNKIDLMSKGRLLPLIDAYQKEHGFAEIIPISALTGDGLDRFVAALLERLPEGPPHFPPEQFTDQPERFLAAEIVREKVIRATYKEVPHAVAVLVDSFEEEGKLIRIRATIYVEREGQKGIIIGRGGEMLKKTGTAARQELEEILGAKVFLELHVKVQRNWRENPAIVRMLDWRRQLEQLGRE